MIVPMKKVSVVVLEKERIGALEKLRAAGVLHLEKRGVVTEALSKLVDRRAKAETAQGLLLPYEEKKKKGPPRESEAAENGGGVIDRALVLNDERKSLQEQIQAAGKETTRLEKWGNFDPLGFVELAEAGVRLVPYELPPSTFAALPPEREVIVLSRDKSWVRFLSVGGEIEGETPFALPEKSSNGIREAIFAAQERIGGIDAELTRLARQGPAVETALAEIKAQIEFEAAGADMETLEGVETSRTVSWLSGYIPKDDLGVLKRVSSENGWALLADDPGPDDAVPTKLKNNRLASLIYPLTDFLEVVPGYHEADISGWFLFFFVIFFGMIFGDAGYGALVLIAAFIGISKTAKKGVPAVLKLLLLLGASNFIWGVLTCSWFGIGDMTMVPAFLRNLSLPLISNVTAAQSARDAGLVQQNLMIFCFSLALMQLSIGHVITIIRGRSLKVLGDLGSIAMLAGMYFIVLSLIASNNYRQIPLIMPMVYVFGGGFLLNFMFANYEGNFGRSVLESVKNIISVILGIANVFSDIMSYIRLWAVGLAGAAISSTVNAMAGPMLGHLVFFIFGILLLVFGHGLNLVLNVLSVLVHGVRLNTLEFSGHVGLTWSGTAYRPFAKR